jgi:hypothetical protein
MQAIQKELGEKDEFRSELADLENRVTQKKMSEEALDKCTRELRKLKMMSPMSAEATVVRNYIDWVLALPWYEYTEDRLDIAHAARVLDEDHYGLRKVRSASSSTSPSPRWSNACRARSSASSGARRRQDVTRALRCARNQPELRAPGAGRRARRGGDPRTPAHHIGALPARSSSA